MKEEKEFNLLCEKIAEGKASPDEISKAFQDLNQDLANFEDSVKKQLEDLKK